MNIDELHKIATTAFHDGAADILYCIVGNLYDHMKIYDVPVDDIDTDVEQFLEGN